MADRLLLRSLPLILLSSLIMAAALWFAADLLAPWLRGPSQLERFGALIVLVGAGVIVYIAAVQLTGAMTIRRLMTGLRRTSGPA